MVRTKCKKCGLVNVSSEVSCQRCGGPVGGWRLGSSTPRGPREAAKKSSWLYTILFLTLICTAATYLFTGVEKSVDAVKVNDVNRIAKQPKQPDALSSRSEQEQKRVGSYKNAIQNSPGLAESQKRLEETQKLMKPEQSKSN